MQKKNPVDARTARINFMTTQKVRADVETLAQIKGTTISDLIHGLLAAELKKNARAIETFRAGLQEAQAALVEPQDAQGST